MWSFHHRSFGRAREQVQAWTERASLRHVKLWMGPVATLVAWFVAGEAAAYCRQNSCQDDRDNQVFCERDERRCIVGGKTLHYKSPCLSFGVAAGQAAVLGLSDQEFESLVARAFERWQSVDCGDGRGPGLSVQSAGVVETERAFYCKEPSLNLSVWLLMDDWQKEDSALGYANSIYAEDDAEIFDCDVELNAHKILMEVPEDLIEDALLSIITHEAGHFLGLAHSDDTDAVMFAAYNRNDLLSRDLTPDDVDGICAVFPPSEQRLDCSSPGVSEAALDEAACERALLPPTSSSCAIVDRGPRNGSFAGAAVWGMLGVFAWSYRRRRSRFESRWC